jgi:hypothetical protein
VTLGSDSCSVCCAQAPAAGAMIATPAMTHANPGTGGHDLFAGFSQIALRVVLAKLQ